MKRKNVDYKKITVEIPYITFLEMDCYCTSNDNSNKKDMFYCDFINLAILEYIHNHI